MGRVHDNLNGPVVTDVLGEGQPYVDEPVYKMRPAYIFIKPELRPQLTHYRRVPLRWMKRVNGKLVPK